MHLWPKRKRKPPRDRHREFIYLDEVSVISLLAALQGEIKESVTETLSRTEDYGLTAAASVPKSGTQVESRLGSSKTSTSETARRAVIQSTFRDLWRRDVGVLLHDATNVTKRHLKPVNSVAELVRRLHKLKHLKLATDLANISRGDVVEMEVTIEADYYFKMVAVGTTVFDLFGGNDGALSADAKEFEEIRPKLDVLRELLDGLVPIRGRSTSHCVMDVDGRQLVVASEILGPELQDRVRPLELVGYAEESSFWRDLRRTVFSNSTFTAYARVERPSVTEHWSPLTITRLLDSVSPGMGTAMSTALAHYELGTSPSMEPLDRVAAARPQLESFARQLTEATGANPDAVAVDLAVEDAVLALAGGETASDRRRAFEPIVTAVAAGTDGADIDRALVQRARATALSALSPQDAMNPSANAPITAASYRPNAVQVEVGFVALYW